LNGAIRAGGVSYLRPEQETEMHPGLRPFVRIVAGLGAILGGDCEVLLHDVTRLERSIVACSNEHVTGRPVGSPMSAYGLQLLNSDVFSKNNDVYIYTAKANNGALIRCGVIAVRDGAGEIIGLMCLHFDTEKARAAKEFIDAFLNGTGAARGEPVNEFFGIELEDVFKNAIQELGASLEKPISKLSKNEKKTLLKSLEERGFFMMKGAVEFVAREMGNSKFTIYGYMREINAHRSESSGRKCSAVLHNEDYGSQ